MAYSANQHNKFKVDLPKLENPLSDMADNVAQKSKYERYSVQYTARPESGYRPKAPPTSWRYAAI